MNTIKKMILVMSGTVLLFLTTLCIMNHGLFSMHGGEIMTIYRNSPRLLLFVCAAGAALLLPARFLNKSGMPLSPAGVFAGCAVIELLLGLYLIFNVNQALYYDEKHVYDAVHSFINGDFSELLPGGYFYSAPHQLGLAVYETILNAFSSDYAFFYLVNLMEVIGIHWFLWKLSRLMFPERPDVEILTILLSLLFLPLLFFILWLYGEIPGLFFLLGAVYFSFRALREKQRMLWVPALLMGAISYVLRNNNLIPLIALCMVLAMESLRLKRRRALWSIPLLGLMCLGMNAGIRTMYSHLSGMEIGDGIPMALYAAMGLQNGTADGVNPGWYNQYNWEIYKSVDYDSDAASEQALADIAARFSEFLENPSGAVDFFYRKLITTWCDPTYQSLWCSPLHISSGPMESSILQSLRGEGDGVLYRGCILFLSVLNILIFGFSLGFVFRACRSTLNPLCLFPLLTLLGVFCFHLVWETKSRYVFAAPYLLIPLAAAGMTELSARLLSR